MKQFFIIPFFAVMSLLCCTSPSNSKGYTDLDVAAFKAKMVEPGIVLLDVRTPEETVEGMINGAIAIDYESDNFETEIATLDKSKTYLVYCQKGGRSSNACKTMAGKGFKNLYNLKGGYLAWASKK